MRGKGNILTFRPLRTADRQGTSVVVAQFDERGNRLPEPAIITQFGGSHAGRPEAERLCHLLNRAYEEFHRGTQPEPKETP